MAGEFFSPPSSLVEVKMALINSCCQCFNTGGADWISDRQFAEAFTEPQKSRCHHATLL